MYATCAHALTHQIASIEMPRDKATGKRRGFAFIMYEDQRSTVLAVDNGGGAVVLNRTLRVDHVRDFKHLEEGEDGKMKERETQNLNALPELIGASRNVMGPADRRRRRRYVGRLVASLDRRRRPDARLPPRAGAVRQEAQGARRRDEGRATGAQGGQAREKGAQGAAGVGRPWRSKSGPSA